jgi:hypothetical protein
MAPSSFSGWFRLKSLSESLEMAIDLALAFGNFAAP